MLTRSNRRCIWRCSKRRVDRCRMRVLLMLLLLLLLLLLMMLLLLLLLLLSRCCGSCDYGGVSGDRSRSNGSLYGVRLGVMKGVDGMRKRRRWWWKWR